MQASLLTKLEKLKERQLELERLLADPSIIADQTEFRGLSREHAEINPVVECYKAYLANIEQLDATREMLSESDAELRALAMEEYKLSQAKHEEFEQELQILLLPRDEADNNNIFIEIRAGVGGEEAALFVAELYRMYSKYAELRGWQIELLSISRADAGGYKEVIARIVGFGAYSRLKFESGAHRVQRVPATEAQGRVHTSACTVAILPEVDEVTEVDIDPADLRIDTYRASGAGGQHVNKTDSAIRITHLPTGIVVECQDERSQHKNRSRAMSLLRSRLLAAERERQQAVETETRRNLVGSGDRSERIRTYNFPQGRVTDHRINLTLYQLEEFMEGKLDDVIEPLISEHQADLMAAVGAT